MLGTNLQVFIPHTVNYSPVKPNTSVIDNFEKLNSYFQSVQNYQISTDVMTSTYQFSNSLLSQNNITPDEAGKQWDSYIENMSSVTKNADEATRLRMQRYLETKKVETLARINAKHQQNKLLSAVAQTTDAITQYVDGVSDDPNSYMDAVNHIQTQLNNSVASGIIKPTAAEKMKQEALSALKNNFISATIDKGKFDDYKKSGIFNNLGISESTILKASKLNEGIKMRKMRDAEYMKKLSQYNVFEKLSESMGKGQLTLSDIDKFQSTGQISLTQANALRTSLNNKTSSNPNAINNFNNLYRAIRSGIYASDKGAMELSDIMTEMVNKNELTPKMMETLGTANSNVFKYSETHNNLPDFTQNAIKNVGKGIEDTMSNILSQFPIYSSKTATGGLTAFEHQKKPKLGEYASIAKVRYQELVQDYVSKYKNITLGKLTDLRQQAVVYALSPFLRESFISNNQTYFDKFKVDYGINDTNLINKIADGARIWALKYHYIDLNNLPSDFESKPIKIPVLNKKEAGVDALYFKLTSKGIIPADDTTIKALEKIYGKKIEINKKHNGLF